MKQWWTFETTECMIATSPHDRSKHRRSVNNFWSCICGNHGIACIFELIMKWLTASICINTQYNTNTMVSNIIVSAKCKTAKKWLMDFEYMILVRYYCQTAKARALYESTDGPTRQSTYNPPTWDKLGDITCTVSQFSVQDCCQPRLPIWHHFSSNADRDPKWLSVTIANTTWREDIWMCVPLPTGHESDWSVRGRYQFFTVV